ncbi:MAG TPA: hypothetical protein DCY47_19915, partial [Candidatus Accumulibacter sp.]|nr:hypothetical protein [Accumulibacter sp.]
MGGDAVRTPGLGDADGDGEDRRLPGVPEAFAGGRPARPAHTEAIAATPFDATPGRLVGPLVEESPVDCTLSALAPVRLEVIRDTALVTQWNAQLARWHPLGFQGAFGYRLRYFIMAGGR